MEILKNPSDFIKFSKKESKILGLEGGEIIFFRKNKGLIEMCVYSQ